MNAFSVTLSRAVGGFSCLTLLLALAGMTESAAAEVKPEKVEPFDVICLTDARPVVIRINVAHDGKSIQQGWKRFADVFFAKLDVDKNGTLDEKELANLQPLFTLLTGQNNRQIYAIPMGRGSMAYGGGNGLKPMNREEFGEYLKKSGYGPLRVTSNTNNNMYRNQGYRPAGQPTPEELDKVLLELLDTNNDGKISVEEFKAGIDKIAALDTDENELISVEEVVKRPIFPFFIGESFDPNQPLPSPGVELFPLMRKGADTNLARQMLIRYGPKPKIPQGNNNMGRPGRMYGGPMQQQEPTVKRLTRKDLKLSDALFASLDQDGDGELDTEELARYGQNSPPEVEIAIRLGKVAGDARPAEVIRAGKRRLRSSARPHGNEVTLEVPGLRLDIQAPSDYESRNPRSAFRKRYLDRFHGLDTENKGYIEKKEADNDFLFSQLFSFFDKDKDGKIFEKELLAALDEVDEIAAAAAGGIVAIDLTESDKGLFGLIDADGDGKLSIMELRAMPQLVERFAANKEAGLALSDVPRRFEATLSLGVTTSMRVRGPRNDYFNPQPARPQVGPAWFQKMDRNRDGFVSRREFLGTDEEFRKLDLNGDGLISVEEAEAADKAAKAEKK